MPAAGGALAPLPRREEARICLQAPQQSLDDSPLGRKGIGNHRLRPLDTPGADDVNRSGSPRGTCVGRPAPPVAGVAAAAALKRLGVAALFSATTNGPAAVGTWGVLLREPSLPLMPVDAIRQDAEGATDDSRQDCHCNPPGFNLHRFLAELFKDRMAFLNEVI